MSDRQTIYIAMAKLQRDMDESESKLLICARCGRVALKYGFHWIWEGEQLKGPFCCSDTAGTTPP